MRYRFEWLIVLAIVLLPAFAYAQGGPKPEDPTTTPVQWYGTKAGIIAATAIGVSVLKRLLGNVPALAKVPTWLYGVLVSGALTFLAVNVWGTLPGDLWQTMSEVVMNAGAASGFYEWLSNPGTTLSESAVAAGVPVNPSNLPDRTKI